ncbi:hypothetical protein FB550_102442 [Neobacillus bataviensis]|uniref:Uncharacterized protein n=1 Tax=Neobacillus bataviensis TaxID=220685 RepID=A0A561DSY3_9BACI|nr:hypothetical protein FB550_102442 [Neobacillus bataviensis]
METEELVIKKIKSYQVDSSGVVVNVTYEEEDK